MSAQQHRILRQVIEARGCSVEDSQRLRAELREVHYRRLAPLMERICSELAQPGRVQRIERLEIDLGAAPLGRLEAALAEKFEPAFRSGLAAAMRRGAGDDGALELLAYFLRTGMLPWWADASGRGALPAALAALLRRAPEALRAALRGAARPERARRRLVSACADALLGELLAALAPARPALAPGATFYARAIKAQTAVEASALLSATVTP